jgi:hypothetical protein
MIYFEKVTKKADEQRFPGIIVKGCLFHFGQYLFKNFVKQHILKMKNYNAGSCTQKNNK